MEVKGGNSNSVEAKNQWRYNNMHACVCVCVCVYTNEWKLFKLIARGTLFPVYMNVTGTGYFKQAVIWAELLRSATQKRKETTKLEK